MENQRVGVITIKMLPLCKKQCRSAVKQLVNKYVLKSHKQGKVLYYIEGTKYSFTREDFLHFMNVKAIIPVETFERMQTEKRRKAASLAEDLYSIDSPIAVQEEARVANLNKTSAMEAIKFAQPESEASAKILSSYTKNLSDTTFFDQAAPKFSIEEPKSAGLFEKKDNLFSKLDGVFDRFGFKAKNKIVSAVSGNDANN